MRRWFLLTVLLAPPCFAETVTFTVGEWAPFTGEALPENGVAVAVVRAAASAAGMTAVIGWAPWKRAESNVANGVVFGSFPYLQLAERGTGFVYSDVLFVSGFAVLALRSNPATKNFQFQSAEAFARYRVGFTLGTDALRLMMTNAGAQIEETVLIDQSIAKLSSGRIDFVIEDRNVLLSALRRLNEKVEDYLLYDQRLGDPIALRLMANQSYPGAGLLLKRFNEGLAKIRNDGTYSRIVARYGLVP